MISYDSIVALASPRGESAIGLIRISGALSSQIAKAALGKSPTAAPNKASLAYYKNQENKTIDQCLYVFFEGPRSYTGEDMLEIHCHGNPIIIQQVIKDIINRGCRIAEPGEFTQRAFLNGKINLTQAEAIADLIYAKSERALELAQQQLQGELGKRIQAILDKTLEVLAQIEAYIDFPEEDLPPEDQIGPLFEMQQILESIEALLKNYRQTPLLKNGIKTVILGSPNAGKSSLLNHLLGHERALVSPVPGTTRDYIAEFIKLEEYTLQLVDTAGIRETENAIETRGIDIALQQAQGADFYIWVIDQSAEWPTLPEPLQKKLTPERTAIILNKSDSSSNQQDTKYNHYPKIRISLKTGENTAALPAFLKKIIETHLITPKEGDLLINERHEGALQEARKHLMDGLSSGKKGMGAEFISSDLRLMIESLGQIVGKVDNESILDRLFANFCIGK